MTNAEKIRMHGNKTQDFPADWVETNLGGQKKTVKPFTIKIGSQETRYIATVTNAPREYDYDHVIYVRDFMNNYRLVLIPIRESDDTKCWLWSYQSARYNSGGYDVQAISLEESDEVLCVDGDVWEGAIVSALSERIKGK